jgi:peptidoglycan/xylan/chitin deacetylase (PgdA/CDA1 family)
MNIKPSKQQLLSLLPDRLVLTRGSRGGNAIYLTFDDGPHPEHTPRVLDLLAAHGAHASFFLIGQQVERYPRLVERIVAEGHMLGNHSYSHPSGFGRISLRQQLQEIGHTDRLLAEFDQRLQHCFRPPRGSLSLGLLLHFAGRRRRIVYWSYDSMDYQHQSDAEVATRLRHQPPLAGDIILMHDDNACAGKVLGMLLPQWLASGRELNALPGAA